MYFYDFYLIINQTERFNLIMINMPCLPFVICRYVPKFSFLSLSRLAQEDCFQTFFTIPLT